MCVCFFFVSSWVMGSTETCHTEKIIRNCTNKQYLQLVVRYKLIVSPHTSAWCVSVEEMMMMMMKKYTERGRSDQKYSKSIDRVKYNDAQRIYKILRNNRTMIIYPYRLLINAVLFFFPSKFLPNIDRIVYLFLGVKRQVLMEGSKCEMLLEEKDIASSQQKMC